ncbi:YfhO family protein [Flavobacterium sp. GT3R68]|uniref:YfhO family protein n=1 Tax=Flavobacterium sp. GT3R68 TaxID=2594437 RepID=UPI000F88708F|nr:YfhO family protein [Flavobacterium sp. GT3R68]RTY95263.1 hypothetical protein EKL32_07485 [Flavobacterium sp. GSN2]TRW90996.1 YfhO family protein [Flavobacterium sp. GT3R68]
MKTLQKFYPHALALLGFVLISLIYFYPVLQGKKISQSDIVQYTGMAKEQNDFRAVEHAEPYWTNSAFGGMPTYQLGANYPHDYVGKLDDMLRFLPRPADYLFLYFLGFYALLLVLKTDPLKAFFGALAFGLSTYLIVIIGVGHNAKAHAIAYMPLVIAGFILVFNKKYIKGGLLTMLAVALEINANHFQMTYYLLLLLLVLGCYFLYEIIKNREAASLPKIAGTFLVAIILAVGVNATSLLATKEYADFSMRGKSELSFNPDGSKNTTTAAMSNDYITEYSYGVAESLNLIAPRLFGGSSSENVGTDSKLYEFMVGQGATDEQAKQFAENGPTYWGSQPMVAAPAYIGAIVFFLCILALFHDKRTIKYAFLAGAILSLLLSWGKNFPVLTDFFIQYVPMYDKFRAVSSIQVLLELCIPVLAVMGLQSFFKENENQKKSLLYTGATAIGLVVLLFLAKSMFSFSTENDEYFIQTYGKEAGSAFLDVLKEDRISLYTADLLRSGFFMIVAFIALWFHIKGRLAQNTAIIIIGVFMVGDLFFVDKKYVSNTPEQFKSAYEVDVPFQETPADVEILKDKSIFRVYEIQGRLQGRTSYFHKSVGGYSAVRPRRYNQVFDYQVDQQLGNIGENVDPKTMSLTKNIPILNALNVKYLLLQTQDGQSVPITNPNANGNAWFVDSVKFVNSPDAEMKALSSFDSKKVAIVNESWKKTIKVNAIQADSLATITVDTYKPNYIKYTSNNTNEGMAVFSEVYYPKGWHVYIDGKATEYFSADFVLRALQIPAGKHTIEFKFEPEVVKTGSAIALFSSIAMILLLAGGIYFENKKKVNV